MLLQNTNVLTKFARIWHDRLQALAFLVIFPLVNSIFAATALWDLELFNIELAAALAVRLWLVFGASLLILAVFQWVLPEIFNAEKFFAQLAIHGVVVVGMGIMFSHPEAAAFQLTQSNNLIMARVLIVLELIVYLSVRRILVQQKKVFDAALIQKETELNVLRAQSNPHFLFNTLNLIASEISEHPANAKEIVFDLSDLMRANLKLAQQPFTTVEEELKLVELYLTLQQKRFKDRLTFSIDLAPESGNILVPALLLQPVVENTIKYGIAPYKADGHIALRVTLKKPYLEIVVKDSGPYFDDSNIEEGDGFRILRQTLRLRYKTRFELSLKSTVNGGLFTLRIPIVPSESEHE